MPRESRKRGKKGVSLKKTLVKKSEGKVSQKNSNGELSNKAKINKTDKTFAKKAEAKGKEPKQNKKNESTVEASFEEDEETFLMEADAQDEADFMQPMDMEDSEGQEITFNGGSAKAENNNASRIMEQEAIIRIGRRNYIR